MPIAPTLPALAFLISLKGFPGFGLHKAKPAPADTLPPPWRPVSRLTLENDFVTAALPPIVDNWVALKLTFDPRTLRVNVDPDSGTVSAGPLVNTVPVGPPLRLTFDSYADQMSRDNFQRLWVKKSVESINTRAAVAGPTTGTGGLSFKLPSPLPKQVQSLLGPGGPAINVAGSENIRFSGQSNWTNQQIGPLGQKRSLFPSLDMQQDLDIRLEGQLSDRIKVNLLQNSANQVPLANRIYINYKGEEDDMVQQLALGNTDLSLPGTQYVSYSGKNDGLFGIKSALRFGPADFTLLASKQEGRSERATYTGGASHQTGTLADMDYIRGVFYLLYDPNTLPSWLPPSVAADPNFAGIDIPETSIKVYLDDYNYGNDINVVRGKALINPEDRGTSVADSSAVRGSFALLNPGANADYEILRNVYGPFFKVLRLVKQVSGEQRLGITYQARALAKDGSQLYPPGGALVDIGGEYEVDAAPDTAHALRMKLLRPPQSQLSQDAAGNYDTTNVFTRVRDLELHNFYQLPGQRIDPTTFTMAIQRGVDQPPVTFLNLKDAAHTPVPYIEALGLDNVDETTGQPLPGHDAKVDGSLVSTNSRAFIDYENGILFFPDIRPFAPRLAGPDAKPFEQFVSSHFVFRRDSLTANPDSADGANPFIYDKYNPRRDLDVRYYINLDFTAARAVGDISLGRGNILEGSEVITINGDQLVRDRDYSIDYDIGRVTLKRQLGPADQLNVNYSYAPLFAQAGRTLIGSDFRIEGRDKRFGAALMYESTGAQDIRPRLGEEPSRSIIGDLNTEFTLHPDWITHLVDRLPGIRTTTQSDFHVQAEMGLSLPNPNTKNVVYLDDMEGVKDAVSLSMTAEHWLHSSVPSRLVNGISTPLLALAKQHNAEIQWYSPPSAVKEKELNPDLTQAQGSDNSRQVLALSIPRRPTRNIDNSLGSPDTLWAGLTYSLDKVGLDLSRAQFIDIWVNDFNDHHNWPNAEPRVRGLNVKLHLDLGVVSEDQMRSPDEPPNGALDTEDLVPRDNVLSVTGGQDEDTGVDGLKDKDEPGFGNPDPNFWRDLTTASAADPGGDDFHTVNENYKDPIDTRRFFGTNGTEANKNLLPFPDTEDLNLNNNIDTSENYFEYTIELGQRNNPYLVTDVQRDYPGRAVTDSLNGWRRYRIPLSDSLRRVFGSPDLTLARHLRLWMEGIMRPDPPADSLSSGQPVRPLIVLGGLDIVGSRWQTAILDSAAQVNGTTLTLNSVNTIDNPYYVAPFDPGETLAGSQSVARREQSLSLEFRQLMPGQTLEAFKTFSVEEDYSRYKALDWFATGFNVSGFSAATDTALYYFVRFSSDELGQSYYEYRTRLPRYNGTSGGWQTVHLPLTDLSNLKLRPDFPINDPIHYSAAGSQPGDSLIVNGRPSFTRLRRISVGLVNASNKVYDSGQLWYDELRATDVAKDVGHASRLQMDGKFANLFRYNLAYNARDANFVSVGESRGSGNSTSDLTLGGGLDIYRFFEGTGIVIPLSGTYSRNTSQPMFTAGDDVVRTGALQANSETGSESKSLSASYSRSWSDRSNPFLRYTLGGITGSYTYSTSDGHGPTSLSNGETRSATVSYGISPRNLLRLPIPHTRINLFPLPEHLFWNYGVSTTNSQSFVVLRDGTVLPQTNIAARSAAITFGADTRPLDILHHHFDAVRSLTLPDNLLERIGFINLGRVTQWRQSFDSRYAMTRGPWLSPSFSWNSNYNQDNRPDLSPDMSVRAINNGQGISGSWALPFDRLGRSQSALPDSTHRGPRFSVGSLLSRLGSFSADASVNQSSSYSRLAGVPSIPYLVGITSQPGFSLVPGHGVTPQLGNSSSQSFNWRTAGRTRLALGADVYMSVRAEYNNSKNNVNGLLTRSIATKFPDFDLDYGRLAQITHLTHFLENPTLRTSYTRSVQTDFLGISTIPTGRSISSQWSPLVSVSGTFKNQTRAELRIERRVSERENFQLVNSITTSRNTDVNLNLSRAYSKGQKISVLGRESTVRSNVNLSLAMVYSKESGETRQAGYSQPQLPVDRDRLSLTGNGSYSFSNNVTGNLTLGYGLNRDIQRDIISQNIRVEVRAAFTF